MRRLRILALEAPSSDPKTEMAALASQFPGALREMDELPLEEIDARIAMLDAATRDTAALEPWMEAVVLFHELTRGALAAKKWLSGRKEVGASDRVAFEEMARSGLPEADEALAWAAHLDAVASPPRGKLTDLVFARIAAHLAISEDEARALVFARRRERITGRREVGKDGS